MWSDWIYGGKPYFVAYGGHLHVLSLYKRVEPFDWVGGRGIGKEWRSWKVEHYFLGTHTMEFQQHMVKEKKQKWIYEDASWIWMEPPTLQPLKNKDSYECNFK